VIPGLGRRCFDGLPDPVGGLPALGRVGVWKQQRELFTADPGESIRTTGCVRAKGDKMLQHRVTGLVPLGVVDVLEVIQVEQGQGEGTAVTPCTLDLFRQPFVEGAPVEGVCEGVLAGQLLKTLLFGSRP